MIAVVGPCGAGKSTLVAALRARGIHAREVAQEHSYVPAMWQRLTRPDLLVYLAVSKETAQQRLKRELTGWMWQGMEERLTHARAHADLTVETDALTPAEVVERVCEWCEHRREEMLPKRVLVELRIPHQASEQRVQELASQLKDFGFDWDQNYLVPLREQRRYRYVLLRGELEGGREPDLEARPNVVRVWSDAPIHPVEGRKNKPQDFGF